MTSRRSSPGFLVVSCLLLVTWSSAQDRPVDFSVITDRTAYYAGYTTDITQVQVASPTQNPVFRVVDMEGRIVRTWQDPLPDWAFAELVKPLSNGHLLAFIYNRSTVGNPPRQKRLAEIDWNGNVVWQWDPAPLGVRLHHDFQRLANGNTVVIVSKPTFAPFIHPQQILDDILVEIGPFGEIVWSWSMAANFGQLGLSPQARSYLMQFPGPIPKSVFHMNSVHALPPNKWEATDPRFTAGNLLISLRELNLVFIIDKASRNIVWSYTGALGQHHARLIEQGLPGAGNILLFDNGGLVGAPPVGREFSRVIEIDPPTQAVVWEYKVNRQDSGKHFFSRIMGSCQRLPNGNTLIAESTASRVFEVTRDGKVVWEFIAQANQVYRAYRLPFSWANGSIPPFQW